MQVKAFHKAPTNAIDLLLSEHFPLGPLHGHWPVCGLDPAAASKVTLMIGSSPSGP